MVSLAQRAAVPGVVTASPDLLKLRREHLELELSLLDFWRALVAVKGSHENTDKN
jgi:hypothetical protein